MIPEKLKQGDEIRIIAPARSLSLLSEENINSAVKNLEAQGFKVSFSKNCKESDIFMSSSIQSRLDDLHEAFSDKNVKAIITVIGGFNSNQLLKYIDYELIKNNPKILCGYSDITAITNAITTKTGLLTYSGLHFSSWAMEKEADYNIESFKKCLTQDNEFIVEASENFFEDEWWMDQENRKPIKNEGFFVINKGKAEGRIIGGNLCTFNLLHGTEFMPDFKDTILFIEDCVEDEDLFVLNFDRDLQSIIHQSGFENVKAIIFGRFETKSQMTKEKLLKIVETKKELKDLPILAGLDFGHTNIMMTFPIGGTCSLEITDDKVELKIIKH
ncbi:MAG: LD-carboxypeptidase [Nanoarchaeota archaeon]|nr:LD-carboxypeptidase [Nanoarchaeota archaeon]